MNKKLLIIIILLCAVPLAIIVVSQNQPEVIAEPVQLEIAPEPEPEVQVLSECQQYYRDIFPSATVYGSFNEYTVTDTYTGPVTTPDEASHGVAKRFYSYHEAALNNGVTFAGRYTISDWAFTGLGQMFAVIDVESGTVYPFPYVVDWDFSYRADSNLIIINPIETMAQFATTNEQSDIVCDMKWYSDMKTYYFIFEDKQFKLLGPADIADLQPSSWLGDEVI